MLPQPYHGRCLSMPRVFIGLPNFASVWIGPAFRGRIRRGSCFPHERQPNC